MKPEITKQDIIDNLILSFINQTPDDFMPFLMFEKVKTEMPDKTSFFSFFKHMIECSKQNSIGNWTLKIEETSWNNGQDTMAYNFHDEEHKFARCSVMVS